MNAHFDVPVGLVDHDDGNGLTYPRIAMSCPLGGTGIDDITIAKGMQKNCNKLFLAIS